MWASVQSGSTPGRLAPGMGGMVADEPVRHAVPHRVDVDQRIGGDPPTESLLAAGQRSDRQWPEGRTLVPSKSHQRGLTSRPVSTLVSDGRHPRIQMLLERGERVEGLVGERIALHVFHAGFRLPLGPGPIRRARARLHVPVSTECQVGGMKDHRAGGQASGSHP